MIFLSPLLFLFLSAAQPITSSRPSSSSLSIPTRCVANTNKQLAFGNPKYFTDKVIPSNKPGVNLKVPKFDVVFDKICRVSPLAKQAFYESNPAIGKSSSDDVYKWKVTENKPNRLVSHVDKIDNYDKLGVPIVRLRSSLNGPVTKPGFGECFSELVAVQSLRQRHDSANAIIDTIYSAESLETVKALQESKYGEPRLFGIGYTKTKQSVVSPREQLTLCGVQDFPSGASVVWGVELEEDGNSLFPSDQPVRSPRSTSHLFAITIIPTGEESFDVEYVLQIEIGGFPGWSHAPIVLDAVKKMFRFADGYCKSGLVGGELAKRLEEVGALDRYTQETTSRVASSDDAVLDKKYNNVLVAENIYIAEEGAPTLTTAQTEFFGTGSEDNVSNVTDDEAEPVSRRGRKRRLLKKSLLRLLR